MKYECPITALGFGPSRPCGARIDVSPYLFIFQKESENHSAAVACLACGYFLGLEIGKGGKILGTSPRSKLIDI